MQKLHYPTHVPRPLVIAGLLTALAAGCTQDDRPKLGLVRGKVTLDGRPLVGARIVFRPVPSERGRASTGFTDAEGNYEMIYIRDIRGASVGSHLVWITPADFDANVAEELRRDHNRQYVLQRRVHPGRQEMNFDLRSDPP